MQQVKEASLTTLVLRRIYCLEIQIHSQFSWEKKGVATKEWLIGECFFNFHPCEIWHGYSVRVSTGLVIQVKAVSLTLKLKKLTFFAQVFCTY